MVFVVCGLRLCVLLSLVEVCRVLYVVSCVWRLVVWFVLLLFGVVVCCVLLVVRRRCLVFHVG